MQGVSSQSLVPTRALQASCFVSTQKQKKLINVLSSQLNHQVSYLEQKH